MARSPSFCHTRRRSIAICWRRADKIAENRMPENDGALRNPERANYLRSDAIYAAISTASFRVSGKLGILGCGSRRKNASFSALKFCLRAIATNGGTSALACFWSPSTMWQDAHQRVASSAPWSGSAAKAAAVVSPNVATIRTRWRCRLICIVALVHDQQLKSRWSQ